VLALIKPDGTDQKDLLGRYPFDEAAGGAWSPDGTHLPVVRGVDGSARYDLWIMDLDGNYIAQVTHTPAGYGVHALAPSSAG
jgi:Tol biopolymer transport system component